MLQLTKQQAKVAHINVREQKEGDEGVLACDIKFHADMPNALLDSLSPGLRAAMYDKPADQLDMSDDHRTVLRFPSLAPLEWTTELKNATVTVHGQTKADNIEFTADVNKILLTPREGGTVGLQFRAQLLPDPEDVGDFSALLGKVTKVSVKPAPQPEDPPVE